jgi:hypothetical protein
MSHRRLFASFALMLVSGCALSHSRTGEEAQNLDAGLGDAGAVVVDGSAHDAGPEDGDTRHDAGSAFDASITPDAGAAPDAAAMDDPCRGGPSEVTIERDGPGLSGIVTNLPEVTAVVRFDQGSVRLLEPGFKSNLGNAYASWSSDGSADAGYFYGSGRSTEEKYVRVATRVALVRGPTRVQDINDPSALQYGSVTELAHVGDIAVFHQEASDAYLAMRLDQVTYLDPRFACPTLATASFTYYRVDGSKGGFAGFERE